MAPVISHHRSSPSLEKLLDQLDENEVHLLLAELNNSLDVHIPVSEAIQFYEKPSSRRNGHFLPTKRAVSSPALSSSRYLYNHPRARDAALPPVAKIYAVRRRANPVADPRPILSTQMPLPRTRSASHSPLMGHRPHRSDLAQRVNETKPATGVMTTPDPPMAKTSRAYKRISRPVLPTAATRDQDLYALLAVYLFDREAAGTASRHPPSLNSPRSMVDSAAA